MYVCGWYIQYKFVLPAVVFFLICVHVYVDEVPSLHDFMEQVAAAIPSRWKAFATQLCLTPADIETIETDHAKSDDRFIAVFCMWTRNWTRLPISWDTILCVLRSHHLNELAVAEALEKWLKKRQTTTNPYP